MLLVFIPAALLLVFSWVLVWFFPQTISPEIRQWFLDTRIIPSAGILNEYCQSRPCDDFLDTLLYIYTGIIGILATLITVFATLSLSRQNQRRQNTVQLLLDIRYSEHYQNLLNTRIKRFPAGEKIEKDVYDEYFVLGGAKVKQGRQILEFLNHHEFLAAAILRGNLDEAMLKDSIRGILCRRTYILAGYIHERRVNRNAHKSYENLVAVYWRWVDKESKSGEDGKNPEWDEKVDLGPRPNTFLSKLHQFALKLPF